MRTRLAVFLFLFSLTIGLKSMAVGGTDSFTKIDYPNATNTWVLGMNPQGDIVGYYGVSGIQHGFFLGRGGFVPIDVPGACRTDAYAINAAGDIVGTYNDPPAPGKACSTGTQHGYLLRHGQFTSIDVPGATFTGAFGINSEGDIVGHFGVPPTGRMNGYMLRNGSFTTYAHPDAEAANKMSCGFGINPEGEIVGHYQDTVGIHGFLLSDSGFTSIDIPDGKNLQAYSINPEGEIAGFYTDLATKMVSGFVLDKWGVFTKIDVPGAVNTYVYRNNPRGDLVGYYQDTLGKWHGFFARR